ncbi:hypothetical protein [Novosphingobium cyanobacteriorum]|uniref:PilZ domain-containing protein n=1 Tax=Novosphingobium cyanobacteriorum TaxID=3024215 RepID=A0ABT6CIT7_9SPHN|nr:hypothetical protein [Novosphingobium cyanobacteriorum]MDF8333831.1 hypothetical protein [Novosphingobium cyanobacteriorum]
MDHEFSKAQVLREVRHPRIVRAQLGGLRGSGQNLRDFVIRNVSEHGLGGSCKGPAPVRGERIVVVLPGGREITGEVRWFRDHAFGMRLDEPFDIAMLSQALQQQAHVSRVNGEWHVESRHRVVNPQVDPSRIRRV